MSGNRTLIIGGPGTGKTTLAASLGGGRSTDETKHLPWSDASAEVAKWFDGDYGIIEGVTIPRALRKWQAQNPGQPPPVDKIIILEKPLKELSPRQQGMGNGVATVLGQLADWLKDVEIERR